MVQSQTDQKNYVGCSHFHHFLPTGQWTSFIFILDIYSWYVIYYATAVSALQICRMSCVTCVSWFRWLMWVDVSQCVSQEWMKDYIYKRWKCWVSRLLSAVFSGRLRSRGLRAQESTFWYLKPRRTRPEAKWFKTYHDLSTSSNSLWNPMIFFFWYPAAQKTVWFPEDVSHALWGLLRISEQTSRAFKLKKGERQPCFCYTADMRTVIPRNSSKD